MRIPKAITIGIIVIILVVIIYTLLASFFKLEPIGLNYSLLILAGIGAIINYVVVKLMRR